MVRSGELFTVVTPIWRVTSGRRGSACVDAVLHQLLVEIRVGAELEGDGERQDAVAGGLREHVEHVLRAVDLLLQRRGHRLGDHLGIRAGKLRRHHDSRRHHLGIFRDRQLERPRSGPPRKMMNEMTPAKIGRSMKNRDRFMARRSGSGSGTDLVGLGRQAGHVFIRRTILGRRRPWSSGRTCCTPSTITRSPGAKDRSRPPGRRPHRAGRGSTWR